jgi:hypothetical protein
VKLKRKWLASDGQLKLHAYLVFDEAGGMARSGFFDNRKMVLGLLAALGDAIFAESFIVIASGTGFQGKAFDSTSEVLTFWMQPWKLADLIKVLEKNEESSYWDLKNRSLSLLTPLFPSRY